MEAWPVHARAGETAALAPLPEHADGVDATAHWLARVVMPVEGDDPPARDDTAVLVDNGSRRFTPSTQMLQRWIGL